MECILRAKVTCPLIATLYATCAPRSEAHWTGTTRTIRKSSLLRAIACLDRKALPNNTRFKATALFTGARNRGRASETRNAWLAVDRGNRPKKKSETSARRAGPRGDTIASRIFQTMRTHACATTVTLEEPCAKRAHRRFIYKISMPRRVSVLIFPRFSAHARSDGSSLSAGRREQTSRVLGSVAIKSSYAISRCDELLYSLDLHPILTKMQRLGVN